MRREVVRAHLASMRMLLVNVVQQAIAIIFTSLLSNITLNATNSNQNQKERVKEFGCTGFDQRDTQEEK